MNAADLSAFGADSLLVGGVRTTTGGGTRISVETANLTVSNAGSRLSAPEIILVANKELVLTEGSSVSRSGRLSGGADALILGTAGNAGSGDGVLLRVTSDRSAGIVREGLGSLTSPKMTIAAGSKISGASVTLDSTFATSLDSQATLTAESIALNSGQVSLQLENPGDLQPTVGLVLSGAALESLRSAQSLALLSYSSIDIYGSGEITNSGSLALHAAEIRAFHNDGGAAILEAPTILIDDSPGGKIPGIAGAGSGTLVFNADNIVLGRQTVAIDGFSNVTLHGAEGVRLDGKGGLAIQQSATITAPVITASEAADYAIVANGELNLEKSVVSTEPRRSGLGAAVSLQATQITAQTDIALPSGSLSLHATNGDLVIGGRLDVGGTSQRFRDVTKATDGGAIKLIADTGTISIENNGFLAVECTRGSQCGRNLSDRAARPI